MSDQKIRPTRTVNSSSERVTRPMARPVTPSRVPNQNQNNFNQSEEQNYNNQFSNIPQMQEESTRRMSVVPPTLGDFNVEDNYLEEEEKNKKKGVFKKVIIAVSSIIVLFAIIYLSAYFGSKGNIPFVDGGSVVPNNTGLMSDLPSFASTQSTPFTGDPVPVKWPADIQPTRMEVFLNPVSGDPVLLLVGDKAGLGTVLRAYDKQGTLTGYWVIIPDTTTTNNTQQSTPQPNQQQNPNTNADQNQSLNPDNNNQILPQTDSTP